MNNIIIHVVDVLISIFKLYVAYYAYTVHNKLSYSIMIYLWMSLIFIIICKPFFKIDITSPLDIKEQVEDIRKTFVENYWKFFFPVSLSIVLGTYAIVSFVGPNGWKLW